MQRFYYYIVRLNCRCPHSGMDGGSGRERERAHYYYIYRDTILNISIRNATTIMYFLCSTSVVIDELSAFIRTIRHSYSHTDRGAHRTGKPNWNFRSKNRLKSNRIFSSFIFVLFQPKLIIVSKRKPHFNDGCSPSDNTKRRIYEKVFIYGRCVRVCE